MLLFSTSQLQINIANGSATWSTIGNPTVGSLTDITVSDDDNSLQRADLFFGNETGAASTISASDDPSLLGKEIYLGDLDPANENNDPWGDTTDEFIYSISGFSASIVKVVVYDGTGSRGDPANYTQYYTIWGSDADAALQALLTTGTLSTGLGFDTAGLLYNDFATAVCFATGTLILTDAGEVPVEDLKPGDGVVTLDHGTQKIRWTRQSSQPLEDSRSDQKPVLIKTGALSSSVPCRNLIVSPQHRILVGEERQLRQFFRAEALAPAKALTSLRNIRFMRGKRAIDWVHFACDQHEVVRANGCWSESLLLGPMALRAMTPKERETVIAIFGPGLSLDEPLNGPPARRLLRVGEVSRTIEDARKSLALA